MTLSVQDRETETEKDRGNMQAFINGLEAGRGQFPSDTDQMVEICMRSDALCGQFLLRINRLASCPDMVGHITSKVQTRLYRSGVYSVANALTGA